MQKVLSVFNSAWGALTESQVWKSIFRHGAINSNRNRVLVMMSNVFLHLHPVKSRKAGIKLRYTWCMGGISFFLFLVLTFTGQATMWMAVFADMGASLLVVGNGLRLLRK